MEREQNYKTLEELGWQDHEVIGIKGMLKILILGNLSPTTRFMAEVGFQDYLRDSDTKKAIEDFLDSFPGQIEIGGKV